MKKTPEQIKVLVEKLREINSPGVVCDSVLECEGWQAGKNFFDAENAQWDLIGCPPFAFCPWCGKLLDWDWGRLRK
jgi:hypothetical protein